MTHMELFSDQGSAILRFEYSTVHNIPQYHPWLQNNHFFYLWLESYMPGRDHLGISRDIFNLRKAFELRRFLFPH